MNSRTSMLVNMVQTASDAKILRTFDDINHRNASDAVLGLLQKRARSYTHRPSKTVSCELNRISRCTTLGT